MGRLIVHFVREPLAVVLISAMMLSEHDRSHADCNPCFDMRQDHFLDDLLNLCNDLIEDSGWPDRFKQPERGPCYYWARTYREATDIGATHPKWDAFRRERRRRCFLEC